MSDELANLRSEVERLLANALRDEERHVAAVDRRDELHVSELGRRDERHLAETAGRHERHLAEEAARHELHLAETAARHEAHVGELEALSRALENRDLLGQAKGVIVASLGCPPEEAFQLIVKQSQHENRKATDIAAEIVQRAITRGRQGRAG